MTPTGQAGYFALQFIFDILVFFFVLRIALRAVHANPRSPFVVGLAKLTNPVCAPLMRIMPYHARWDFAALTLAFALQLVYYLLVELMLGQQYALPGLLVLSVSDLVRAFLNLWFLTIIAEAILSFVRPVQHDPNLGFIADLNRPVLAPFRRFIPNLGGLDLSPLVALFAIKLTEILLVGWLGQMGKGLIN